MPTHLTHSTHYPSDPHRVVYLDLLADGRLAVCSCHDRTRMVVCDNGDEVSAFMEEHNLEFRKNAGTLPYPYTKPKE